MAFLDKLFRWKKKPFKAVPAEPKAVYEPKAVKEELKGTGRYAHVLVRPHTSEKAVTAGSYNQYVFEAALWASKQEISRAIKDLYGIKPVSVNIVKVHGKRTRFGRTTGTTRSWKKVMVTLPGGKTIDVYKK